MTFMSDANMNFRARLTALAGSTLLVFLSGIGQADDTDVYIGNALPPGSEPMVMFSLDWRPNLGSTACQGTECDFLINDGYMAAVGPYTFFDVLRGVLRKVMEPLDGLQVGLMINHDYKNNCEGSVSDGCSDGGFMALGLKSFQKGDGNGAKAAFHAYLDAIPDPQGNASHNYQGTELFFEMYRYLTGQGIWNGHVGFLDFSTATNQNMDVDTPNTMWDTSIESGANYVSPLVAAGACSKLFTVNMMFQVSQQDNDSNSVIGNSLGAGGLGFTPSNNDAFPEVIEWLNDKDLADGSVAAIPDIIGQQNITSYFIVDPTKINVTTTAYARAGGTNAPLELSEDPEELVNTLTDIFNQIISVSTTFVSASVPVNSFNRAEIIDNVYISLFQVEKSGKPTWTGNVKKLRIKGLADGIPTIVDVNDNPAIAADGRIGFSAVTHWTDAGALPPPRIDDGEIAGADGRSVDLGAAGQKVPGYINPFPGVLNGDAGARQLFYNVAGSTNLAPFNADAVTALALQGALGAVDVNEALELMLYARGVDIDDLDGDGTRLEARPWIFGDPLHSRPLPINYGARGGYSGANPAIYIAVASNDGFLRFIRNTATGGAESGEEAWAFMPQIIMDKQKILRTDAAGMKHPYLVDGSPVSYLEDTNQNGTIDAGEKAYLFVGLRRGERGYYALDVSDPENPTLLWPPIKKAGDFAELGNTFSTPRVITTKAGGAQRPALVFGGGYDFNKDLRGAVGTDDSEGNAIYVVDLETGALIWKAVGSGISAADTFVHADFVDSVPSPLTVLDSNGNGRHDRLYFGDTGGNVWRADINGTDTSAWKLTLLARLGRHAPGSGGKVDDRRFFHRGDIVQTFENDDRVDVFVIGSGDRPNPLDKGGVVNDFAYMIKDFHTAVGGGVDSTLEHGDLGDVTNTCLTESSACTADLTNGWALGMTDASGEKILAKPIVIANTVYFTSYLPTGGFNPANCAPSEGTGNLYAVSLKNASAVQNFDVTTDDAERSVLLKSAGIPSEVVAISTQLGLKPSTYILPPGGPILPTSASPRLKTFWFEEEDTDL
jgi:type IV pilus assembly protein PilY1